MKTKLLPKIGMLIGVFVILISCIFLHFEINNNNVVLDEDLNWVFISEVENTFILTYCEDCYDVEKTTYFNIEKMAFQNEFVYFKFQDGTRIRLQAEMIQSYEVIEKKYKEETIYEKMYLL